MQPTKRMTFLIVSTLVTLGAAAGCDQSKAELDSTKQQLTAITAERDSLKTQLDAAKQQATAMQAQVTDLQTKLAAAQTPPAARAGRGRGEGREEEEGRQGRARRGGDACAPAPRADHRPGDGNPQGPGPLLGRSSRGPENEISDEERIRHRRCWAASSRSDARAAATATTRGARGGDARRRRRSDARSGCRPATAASTSSRSRPGSNDGCDLGVADTRRQRGPRRRGAARELQPGDGDADRRDGRLAGRRARSRSTWERSCATAPRPIRRCRPAPGTRPTRRR